MTYAKLFLLLVMTVTAYPQAQQPPARQDAAGVEHLDETPLFRTSVVPRTAKAIDYQYRSGATKIDFVEPSVVHHK